MNRIEIEIEIQMDVIIKKKRDVIPVAPNGGTIKRCDEERSG